MYSFSGRKVRVVHVHFDGKYLVVRLTKYLDFIEGEYGRLQVAASVDNERTNWRDDFFRQDAKPLKIHLVHLLRGCPFRQRHESIDFASLGIVLIGHGPILLAASYQKTVSGQVLDAGLRVFQC